MQSAHTTAGVYLRHALFPFPCSICDVNLPVGASAMRIAMPLMQVMAGDRDRRYTRLVEVRMWLASEVAFVASGLPRLTMSCTSVHRMLSDNMVNSTPSFSHLKSM